MLPTGYRLNENEHLTLSLRPHWWYFSRHILTGIPLWTILGVVAVGANGWVRTGAIPLLGGLAALWILWLGFKILAWKFTYFLVSDQRVVYRTGVVARKGVEIPLARIANINFEQSIWTRIIGAGTLDIESAGREGTTKFSDVRHPDEVQREIYRQLDGAENRSAARVGQAVAGAGNNQNLIAEEIEKLAALRDKGILTDAEFTERKNSLLNNP